MGEGCDTCLFLVLKLDLISEVPESRFDHDSGESEEGEEEAGEGTPQSSALTEGDFVPDSPALSPIELKQELPKYLPALQVRHFPFAAYGQGWWLRAEAGSSLWVSVSGQAWPLASVMVSVMVWALVQQACWRKACAAAARTPTRGPMHKSQAASRAVSSAVTSASAWEDGPLTSLALLPCRGQRAVVHVGLQFSNQSGAGRDLGEGQVPRG